jgi:hypothetical protein
MKRALLAAVLLWCLPVAVGAQQAPAALQRDARIRVLPALPADDWVVGRVDTYTPEAITLRTGGGSPIAVSMNGVRRLEVSRGRNRLAWTAGGAAAGAVAGIVLTRATRTDDPADIGGVRGTADGIANTLVGMLAGAVLGYFVAPERWRAVSLPVSGGW